MNYNSKKKLAKKWRNRMIKMVPVYIFPLQTTTKLVLLIEKNVLLIIITSY